VDYTSILTLLGVAFEVAALNVALGVDNAVIIAMACQPLPQERRGQVLLIGVVSAIALRFALTFPVSAFLLVLPGLKLAAALLLIVIAARSLYELAEPPVAAESAQGGAMAAWTKAQVWRSVLVVICLDAVMSLDNIIATASVAEGAPILLFLGLALSIPAIMYGSLVLTNLFDDWPILKLAGAVLLGWIAGQMAASDPLIRGWLAQNAPVLAELLPALCACYVYLVGHLATSEASRGDERLLPP
jgi:YjbE family integral membrane protein